MGEHTSPSYDYHQDIQHYNRRIIYGKQEKRRGSKQKKKSEETPFGARLETLLGIKVQPKVSREVE